MKIQERLRMIFLGRSVLEGSGPQLVTASLGLVASQCLVPEVQAVGAVSVRDSVFLLGQAGALS